MNKKFTAIILACVLMLLPMVLSGCEEVQKMSAPSSSLPEPTQAPTPEPTAEPAAEPTPTPEPAPEATPDLSEFEPLFKENPIDFQLEEDLANASTGRAVYLAYDDATAKWKMLIDGAFKAAASEENAVQGNASLSVDEQEEWQAKTDEKVQELTPDDADMDSMVSAAGDIYDLYQERGKQVCLEYYQSFGELPDFDAILNAEPMG